MISRKENVITGVIIISYLVIALLFCNEQYLWKIIIN